MEYPVAIPGLEGRRVVVQSAGAFAGPKLLVDGQAPPPGPKKGEFLLRGNDGRDVKVALKPAFPDTVPVLVVDGQTLRLARPLAWYEWMWAGFPLLLLFVGGAIGGALGGAALTANVAIFRSEMPSYAKYVASGGVSFAAVALWLVIGTAIHLGRGSGS